MDQQQTLVATSIDESLDEYSRIIKKHFKVMWHFTEFASNNNFDISTFEGTTDAFRKFVESLGIVLKTEYNPITQRADAYIMAPNSPVNIGNHDYSFKNPVVRAMDVIFTLIDKVSATKT